VNDFIASANEILIASKEDVIDENHGHTPLERNRSRRERNRNHR
jgi:hypothetical protein